MFSQKEPQTPGINAIELLGQQMTDLRNQIQQTSQILEKFMKDATAALNVLDNDILDLKGADSKIDYAKANDINDLKMKLNDLTLIGKLTLDVNDRLNQIEAFLSVKHGYLKHTKKEVKGTKKSLKTRKK